MQDRFKFQYYDEKTKKMYEVAELDLYLPSVTCKLSEEELYHIGKSRFKFENLRQCTGLKDKNGKLIYEGDIVKNFHVTSSMQPKTFTGVVSFNPTQLYWEIEKDGGFATFLNTDDIFEVIGNIYENPELLEVLDNEG